MQKKKEKESRSGLKSHTLTHNKKTVKRIKHIIVKQKKLIFSRNSDEIHYSAFNSSKFIFKNSICEPFPTLEPIQPKLDQARLNCL